ncbi:MAG: helix-turn-helix transcriptional regulator [Clostridia bacterium]|nr:helix-turn-helix transcriptional regulator [Clostridia bacterium]
MIGMNATISNNILMLLKQNEKKQNDLAEALGISKQVMSNMLSGSRMINAIELHQIADYFCVSMESLMKSPADVKSVNAVHALMSEVKTESARKSLEIADEMADMLLFYARVRTNAEELDRAWEA